MKIQLKGEQLEEVWVQRLRALGFQTQGVPKYGELDKAGIDILVYLVGQRKWAAMQVKSSATGVRSHLRNGEGRRFIPVVVGMPDAITAPEVLTVLRSVGVWVAPHIEGAEEIRRDVADAARGPWLIKV